jgi:hypothetical protein
METVNEKLNRYRQIIKEVLRRRAALPYPDPDIRDRTLFDEQSDSYAVIAEGWLKAERIHNIVVHLEIINGKGWIQATTPTSPSRVNWKNTASRNPTSCWAFVRQTCARTRITLPPDQT